MRRRLHLLELYYPSEPFASVRARVSEASPRTVLLFRLYQIRVFFSFQNLVLVFQKLHFPSV